MLYLTTESWNDVRVFEDFIGSFSEGRMSVYFLDAKDHPEVHEIGAPEFIEYIQFHFIVAIDVMPGGDILEISFGKRYLEENTLRWLASQNAIGFSYNWG